MKRFLFLIALLVPSIAAANYPHGFKLTHDSTGKAYQGYYYRYNAYSNKWDRYDVPSFTTDNHSVSYSYTYNYNNASANAGATQSGLYPAGAFRYDELNLGAEEYDSQKYVSSGLAVDQGRLQNQRIRETQAGYTRDKVLTIQAAGDANVRTIQAAAQASGGQSAPQVLQQFNSYSGGQAGYSQKQQGDQQFKALGGTLAATEQACLNCHAAAVAEGKGGNKTHTAFAAIDRGAAERMLLYVSRLDDSNCARKCNLTADAQAELVKFLFAKSNAQ